MQGISYYDRIEIVLNSVFHISYPDSKYQFARICNELGNTIFIISNLSHGSFEQHITESFPLVLSPTNNLGKPLVAGGFVSTWSSSHVKSSLKQTL